MINFTDRTKPDRRKVKIIENGETFHAEFLTPDYGLEGSGENGTVLNAGFFYSLTNAFISEIESRVKSFEFKLNSFISEAGSRIAKIEKLITNTRSPASGRLVLMQEAISSVFHAFTDCATAVGADMLKLTAEEYDALGITAYEYDTKSKDIFGLAAEYDTLTAERFDDLTLTVNDHTLLDFTVNDYDYKSCILLGVS